MKKAARLVVIVATLVLFATACGSSRQAAAKHPQPKWVTDAAGFVRGKFVGHPKPVSVSYQRGQKTLTVTLTFNRTVVCDLCYGFRAPRGRIATITLDARTHREMSFELRAG